jgi:hypothetical protein
MTLPTHPLGNSGMHITRVEIDTFIVDGLYGGGHESL